MNRFRSVLASSLLLAAVLPFSGASGQTTGPQTQGELAGPPRVANGAVFRLTGRFATHSRTVLLQRRSEDGAWVTVRRRVSRENGHFAFDLKASTDPGVVTYRTRTAGADAVKTEPFRVEVVRPSAWKALSVAHSYACGIRSDDSGWCWGRGDSGQLGVGVSEDISEPQRVPGRWREISTSGGRTTCGIGVDGSGWCWGDHPGNGTSNSAWPVPVPGVWRSLTPTSWYDDAWISYVCGIRNDDTAWCWGDTYSGMLGIGQPSTESGPVLTPHQVPGLWRDLTPSAYRQCGIRTDGTGWCWGANLHGELGDGTTSSRSSPIQLPGAWSTLEPGSTTCGIQTDATAWCWGHNRDGVVGDGTRTDRHTPYQLPGAWRTVGNNGFTTCGIRLDDSGWCWGENHEGTVGDGTATDRLTPYKLSGSWRSLATSAWVSCGTRTNETGWCWGSNFFGSVGNGSAKDRLTPYRLAGRWDVITPDSTPCGRRSDQSLWCWGYNGDGSVGDGTREERSTPYRLPGRWQEVLGHRCGIRTNGWAYCWGKSARGRVGAAVTTQVAAPVVLP